MSKGTKSNTAVRTTIEKSDEELLDGLDAIVRDAVGGDTRAVGILAIAFGPTLNDEAKDALGREWEQDSGDVMQEMFLAMCEGTLVFPPIRGAALPWMKRTVREIAKDWVKKRLEEGPGAAG
ncbi:MAG TPA: hypothetical protein VGL81_29510 [Polyangiaceae bacterium]|jgi:DNA-directed RNA polymerase specialized sigma24 family protein